LLCCTSAESGGADVPFRAELQAVARRTYADLSRAGFHVLAIARKSAIPTDNVDASYVARPRRWDMGMVQRFMFGLGPISSVYDFLTFGVMLWVFHAGPELFRAGWFIESLATQTFVIFVIRTAGNPFKSRPSKPLLISVFGGVFLGLIVVLTPVGAAIGLAPLPPLFFAMLVGFVVTYLALVQIFKQRFYAASGWRGN